jgi:hypothetical protein
LESEKQDKLNELRTNIAILEEQLKNGSGWSEAQKEMMAKLKRQQVHCARENESRTNMLAELREAVQTLSQGVAEAESEHFRLDESLAQVTQVRHHSHPPHHHEL